MRFTADSACVFTNEMILSNHATQAPDLSGFSLCNLNGRFSYPVCKLHVKWTVQITQLVVTQRRDLKTRTSVFASNDGRETERSRSHVCSDDQILSSTENIGSSKDLNVEVVRSCIEANLPQSAEHLNQVNLFEKLKAVLLHILASEQWNASRLKLCHRNYLVSATNLIHYLALNSLDVEELKENLSSIGLLNLETINSYVLASLTAAVQLLEKPKSDPLNVKERTCNQKFSRHSMREKASFSSDMLLGPLHDQNTTHIMVTVGQEATESEAFIADLLRSGMTIVRINCAHGDPSVWSEILRRVKESSQMLEKPCRVIMDLAGPKLRTGKLPPGPCVMKISPKRSGCGDLLIPAQIWLSHKGAGPPPSHLSPDAVLSIDGQEFVRNLEVGDVVRLFDARGKQRLLKISRKFHVFSGVGFIAECSKTAYIGSGTKLYIRGKKGKLPFGKVVDVPALEPFVRLRTGDLLIISRYSSHGQDEPSRPIDGVHRVPCSSGYLFDSVKPGDSIAFDDGKIWGVIQGTDIAEIVVSITHAGRKGTKLGSEKSINIPHSNIRFEGFTSKDLMDLEFVASHADMVGISFVRDIGDIVVLRQELEKRKLKNLGIVLKIETKGGFEKLPLMLLEAMKSPNPLGVMIARGDLAVECGWENLADIQEEIISICTAAHVPIIWATQVLESLVKSGVPTRAEITDVSNGRRTNCVMLNKGKHIVEAVSTLDTILRRDSKMKPELKPLVLSSHLF